MKTRGGGVCPIDVLHFALFILHASVPFFVFSVTPWFQLVEIE